MRLINHAKSIVIILLLIVVGYSLSGIFSRCRNEDGKIVLSKNSINSSWLWEKRWNINDMNSYLKERTEDYLKKTNNDIRIEYKPFHGNQSGYIEQDYERTPILYAYYSEGTDSIENTTIRTIRAVSINKKLSEKITYYTGFEPDSYYISNLEKKNADILCSGFDRMITSLTDKNYAILTKIFPKIKYSKPEADSLYSHAILYRAGLKLCKDLAIKTRNRKMYNQASYEVHLFKNSYMMYFGFYLLEKKYYYVVAKNIKTSALIIVCIIFMIYLVYQLFRLDIFKILDRELVECNLKMEMSTKISIILNNKKMIFNFASKNEISEYVKLVCQEHRKKIIVKNIRKEANIQMKKIEKIAKKQKNIFGFLMGDYRIATGRSKKNKTIYSRFESLNRILMGEEIVNRIVNEKNKLTPAIESVIQGYYSKNNFKKEGVLGRRELIIERAKKDLPVGSLVDFKSLKYSQIKNLVMVTRVLKKINRNVLLTFLQTKNFENMLDNKCIFMQVIFLENEEMILEKLGLYKSRIIKSTKNIYLDLSLPHNLKVAIVATGKAVSKKAFLIDAVECLGVKKGNCEFIESTDQRKLQALASTNKLIVLIKSRNKHAATDILNKVISVSNLNIDMFKREVLAEYRKLVN